MQADFDTEDVKSALAGLFQRMGRSLLFLSSLDSIYLSSTSADVSEMSIGVVQSFQAPQIFLSKKHQSALQFLVNKECILLLPHSEQSEEFWTPL